MRKIKTIIGLALAAFLFIGWSPAQTTFPILLRLKNLLDVSTTAPTNGQVLTFLSSTGKWTPATPESALTNISDITNGIVITGAGSDTVTITHDGTNPTFTTTDGIFIFDSAEAEVAAPAGIELSDDDTNYVSILAQEMAADFTITLPAAVAGGANYVANTTGANATLQFSDINTIITRSMIWKPIAVATVVVAGDGLDYFTVPIELNGMSLVSVGAHVYTADTGADHIHIDIYNLTDTADMLSAAMQIEDGEYDTLTSAAPGTINGATDDVATGDVIRIDVTTYAGSSAKGLEVRLGFKLP